MLQPGSTIGILGGGQLGRMLALAAAPLGFKVHIFAPDAECPAAEVAAHWTRAEYDDLAALDRFAGSIDALTYEFENVSVPAAERIAARVAARPAPRALAIAQDRLTEKDFLNAAGCPTGPYRSADDADAVARAVRELGPPAILKTRRFGYDGKGQVLIRDPGEAPAAVAAIGRAPAIVEGFVTFEREVSVIAARDVHGAVACYDPVWNLHRDHILHRSVVPSGLDPAVEAEARATAERIIRALDYVGVLGVEMFVTADGAILVNEIAPRVHNSGHWTMDACPVSQFEQHIRCVAGWPLGPVARHHDVEMVNLIGDDVAAWRALAAEPGARLHLYGKAEARPGRKMGHVNRIGAPSAANARP